MEGSVLASLVCTQCPVLKDLNIFISLVVACDVSIRSDSLRKLRFYASNTKQLEIIAPKLEELIISSETESVHVSARKLAKVVWQGGPYDPRRHCFADVGLRLQLLDISRESTALPLLHHFVEVQELKLRISIAYGTAGYESFLNETKKLPKCETLHIILEHNYHRLAPGMLHLLRRCSSTRKLSVDLSHYNDPPSWYSCPLSCPCSLAESRKIDDIVLNSLEVVEIGSFISSHEEMDFLEQLSRCKATVLRTLVIEYMECPDTPLTKEVCEKVRSICRPDLKVEISQDK